MSDFGKHALPDRIVKRPSDIGQLAGQEETLPFLARNAAQPGRARAVRPDDGVRRAGQVRGRLQLTSRAQIAGDAVRSSPASA